MIIVILLKRKKIRLYSRIYTSMKIKSWDNNGGGGIVPHGNVNVQLYLIPELIPNHFTVGNDPKYFVYYVV